MQLLKSLNKISEKVLPPSLTKNVSKDKIKVFHDEDDVEAHLAESRKRLKDPMEQDHSDVSNPATPLKTMSKDVMRNTDESATVSEQTMQDAKHYIQGLYGKSKVAGPSNYQPLKNGIEDYPENEDE